MTRILLALLLVGCSTETSRETAPHTNGFCWAATCPKGMLVTYIYDRHPQCLCVPGALPVEGKR